MGLAGDLEAFTLLAEAGSFPAAGRRLNLAPSSVARVTDRIEARLGVRLLLRTTRSLTPEGTAYLSSARRTLADLREPKCQAVADPRQLSKRGSVRRLKLKLRADDGLTDSGLLEAPPHWITE